MKTEVTIKNLKEFVKALEIKKIKYIVIAGFGLDGKRGYQTRRHQDLDIICLKKDFEKVMKIVKELKYNVKNKFNRLYKLQREDGSKIDLSFAVIKGDEAITSGRIAITKFPKELFSPQLGNIGNFQFNIAPNELLKTWGICSRKGDDANYSKTLPADDKKIKKIKRVLRKNTSRSA